MKTAMQELIEQLNKEIDICEENGFKYRGIYLDARWKAENLLELEKQQKKEVICKHCEKPISVNDINNHLFMNVKGGGLIHWNCTDK